MQRKKEDKAGGKGGETKSCLGSVSPDKIS